MTCPPMKRRSLIQFLTILLATQCAVSPSSSSPIPARLLGSTNGDVTRAGTARPTTAPSRATQMLARLPMRFEANSGQTDARVKYLARGPNYAMFLKPDEVVMAFQESGAPANKRLGSAISAARFTKAPCVISLKLVGANPCAQISGLDRAAGRRNYFIGKDPKKWRTNVPGYARVSISNVYPGVDAEYYGNGRQLEYDLVVAPHADPNRIKLAFAGAKTLRVDAEGTLVATTSAGEVRQPKPFACQEHDGRRTAIDARYEVQAEHVRIRLGDYDASKRLVIDPVLVYSTAFGGLDNERANAIAVDSSGSVYITGSTPSTDFPTVSPIQPPDNNRFTLDAFVSKLNAAGDALIYSTYLGGEFSDFGNAIAVDAQGRAYVAGSTNSRGFPTTPGAFQPSAADGDSPTGGDAFVTKLNAAGSALVYSTYLGGAGSVLAGLDTAAGIAVDGNGSAYVAGTTFSQSFPTRRALFPRLNRGVFCCGGCFSDPGPFPPAIPSIDAFLTKLNASGSRLVYSTYLGGTSDDGARAVAVDAQGQAYVTGETCSGDFFTAANPPSGGPSNIFLLKMSASGRSIVWGKSLTGSRTDAASSVAIDSSGNAYITGETRSEDLPVTAQALQSGLGGSVAFKTSNSAADWDAINSGLSNFSLDAIAVDPTNPSTVFAASSLAVFKSTDAGASWKNVHAGGGGKYIALDPTTPGKVYSGSFKSTDSGATWSNIVLPPTTGIVNVLVIDSQNTSTVYAGTGGFFTDVGIPGGVFKSTDSGATWRNVSPTGPNSTFIVLVLLIDPKTPTTIYSKGLRLIKSTNGGATWNATGLASTVISAAAIDPTNPLTIYASTSLRTDSRLLKSTDGGATFKPTGLAGISINAIAVDPADPSIVYAGAGDPGEGGGLFKSTDGGDNWVLTSLNGMTVQALSIAQLDPSKVYAAAFEDIDAFVMKFDPSGGLVYSTYLGGAGHDRGTGIGVDAAGNAYVAGRTLSDRFPIKDAVKPEKFNNASASSIFVTKLAMKTNTASLVYSTYLGGDEPGSAAGIAVDGAGKTYVAGTTGFRAVLAFGAQDVIHSSEEVFVAKLATPPIITNASVKGKKLTVVGEGFDNGAVILLNGEPQKTKNGEDDPNLRVIGKKAGKKITPGVPVTLQVRNSDGLVSASFSFTRD